MRWIFLSPHFDDVALSCGGLVWESSHAGEAASIYTICSGVQPTGPLSPFAQSLHARWETGPHAVLTRAEEDRVSCALLGADWRHVGIPDCIYRPGGSTGKFYYATEESLFAGLHPDENILAAEIAAAIKADLNPNDRVVVPLTLGGHVDHRLTRQAAALLELPLLFYADYPYRIQERAHLESLAAQGWNSMHFPVSPAGLSAWQAAVAAHSSQISTFWPHLAAMQDAIRALWMEDHQGVMLWAPPDWYGQFS